MNKKKFGLYIKESRINKNYTQQELADLLFVDVSAVSKWERGVSYPDITLVPDICRVLEISEHELIESSRDEEYRKMKKDATKFNNMKKGTFWTFNIAYAIALLTCFIVNVSVSHKLSWFYIVLASIITAYSFCPTFTWVFSKFKKLVFMVTTFVSMSLLFLTCSLITQNYWFMIAIMGVLLGYFIVCFPILFTSQKNYLDKEKYKRLSRWFLLSYSLVITILICFLLITIYFYNSYNLALGLAITGGICIMPIIFGILNLFKVTSTLNKPLLIGLSLVLFVAICLGLGRAIYLRSTIETKMYAIEDTYNCIKIEGDTFDINVYASSDGKNKVEYKENSKIKVDIKVEDGVLVINQVDERKFYDKLFSFGGYEIDLYLTQNTIENLIINNSTGDINVASGFTFEGVTIECNTGDVKFLSNVLNDLKIVSNTGNVEIKNSDIGGRADLEVSTGDINIENVKAGALNIKVSTGDTRLLNTSISNDFNMTGSTGNLFFERFDAANIYVVTSTGDVKGTILTSKIFVTSTSTGRVDVPDTTTGGLCKIKTKTGNIIIKYW